MLKMPPKVNPTHFHPTTPQASSKSMASQTFPARSSRTQKALKASPAPPGETPQEKVARLREAAARARDAQISPVDKFLVKGRVIADRLHRITTLSLIGITGIATIVTVYALGDMMMYNRRKKQEFIIEQKHLHLNAVATAREAIAHGTATPEQREFLELEEKLDRIEAERRNKPSIFKRGKQWLFSGMNKEDPSVGKVDREEGGGSNSEILRAVEEKRDEVRAKVVGTKEGLIQGTQEAWEKEKKLQREGGMLDQIGLVEENENEKPKSGGWTSWMSRR